MLINKEEAILDWIRQNKALPDTPLFNFLREDPGSCAVLSIPDAAQRKYINHSVQNPSCSRQYAFALAQMKPLSSAVDMTNTDSMYAMRAWTEWIYEQEAQKNYPDFGSSIQITSLSILKDTPSLAQTYQSGMAKYMFSATINYIEKGE